MPNTLIDKPRQIAVLANSISEAIAWLSENHDVREYNGAQRRVTMRNGDVFIVCTVPEHVRACEFNSYIISPSYSTLEDEVKTRLRP